MNEEAQMIKEASDTKGSYLRTSESPFVRQNQPGNDLVSLGEQSFSSNTVSF
jgi:hypothetical protein